MLKVLIFLWKYKILKEPRNLSYHTKEFFNLSKNNQQKVLDKYFRVLDTKVDIAPFFTDSASRYYQDNEEITFFNSNYFDKLLITHNINNIVLIDKFRISKDKINYLIEYAINYIKDNKLKLNINNIIIYPDKLPNRLSKNIKFMEYMIKNDYSNIKYLTINPEYPNKCRKLIKEAIELASNKKYNIELFLKNDKSLPKILSNDINFIIYLISNDIDNIKYLNDEVLESLTISNKELLINTIIKSLNKNPDQIDLINSNYSISSILNKNTHYISNIIKNDISNITYIDWHNIIDKDKEKIINEIVTILRKEELLINIEKYPFKEILFENYKFMEYLIEDKPEYISYSRVSSLANTEKLVQLFFKTIEEKKYIFKLNDFLNEDGFINHYLIENKNMLYYFFKQNIPVVKYINFFNLNTSYTVVDNILKIIDKKNYEFNNEDFLIDNKYPIALSNHYRFMRFVIDKNFNNLSYINTSMIDERELTRIINYACKMVYYIRGNNKKLTFDIDGYFKNSDIIKNKYFLECLKSLK